MNTYKNKAPFTAKVISVKRIVGPQATGETCHIIMNHEGKMPYWEGQSYGVIPPGENPKKPGKPNTVRLYSIASSRYGDDMTGTTTSLCVRRATYSGMFVLPREGGGGTASKQRKGEPKKTSSASPEFCPGTNCSGRKDFSLSRDVDLQRCRDGCRDCRSSRQLVLFNKCCFSRYEKKRKFRIQVRRRR